MNSLYHPPMVAEEPLDEALRRVGDRWALKVVEALLEGPRRFTDLQESIEGIAPNILSQRLRHLAAQGVVVPRPYSRKPPRMHYQLTGAGKELAGALKFLAQWGARRTGAAPARHEVCGTPMEARWYCPTCGRDVDDREVGNLRYV